MSDSSKFLGDCKWTTWYKCLVCQRCFQFQDKLIFHKQNTECGQLYPTLQQRGIHRSTKKGKIVIAKSVVQDSPIPEKSSLQIENNPVKPTDENCESNIESDNSKIHSETTRKNGNICQECGMWFRLRLSLKEHMLIHSSKCKEIAPSVKQ